MPIGGNVDWGVVGLLASGSIPGALITVIVLAHIPARDSRLSETITTVIGVALLVAAVGLLFQGLTDRVVAAGAKIGLTVPPGARHALTAFAGLLLGVFVSLTSVGAGAAGIAAIRQLYPSLAIVRLVGSDIAHAMPLTLLAGSGHWLLGDVQWKLLTLLLIGSIPGIILASRLAHYIPEAILRRVLGLVLLPTAAAMLFL
jgi:uncharacterized protein